LRPSQYAEGRTWLCTYCRICLIVAPKWTVHFGPVLVKCGVDLYR
jgi:hypothetical protein